jgi:hypothetical protein
MHLHLAHLTLMQAKRMRRWYFSKSISGLCNGDVALAPVVSKRGANYNPMLTCIGCRVVEFCSADHQKMVSKKTALGI